MSVALIAAQLRPLRGTDDPLRIVTVRALRRHRPTRAAAGAPATMVCRCGLMSALAWLAGVAAQMSGQAADAIDPATVRLVLDGTRFGAVWQVQLALALLIVAATWLPAGRGRMLAVLAAGMILALGISRPRRHAGRSSPGAVHRQLRPAPGGRRSLAGWPAAAGVGAAAGVPPARRVRATMVRCLERFSKVGLAAVATLSRDRFDQRLAARRIACGGFGFGLGERARPQARVIRRPPRAVPR